MKIKTASKHKTEQQSSFYLLIMSSLVLIILTLLFYWPSLNYEFVFDDVNIIKKFFHIRTWGIKDLFFNTSRWISVWLNTFCFSLGGFNPFWYRFFNLCFHISTGIILLNLFYRLLNGLKKESFFKNYAAEIAFLLAAAFLLHPVQTQTVTYAVQGQLEGLAALFTSLILLFYFLASKAEEHKKYFFYSATIMATILSTGTKEIAIVAPTLVMLMDWFFIAQGSRKDFKTRMPFMLVLSFTSFAFYCWLLKPTLIFKAIGLQLDAPNNIGNIVTETASESISPLSYMKSQFKVTLHYLFIYIWPFNISADYDWKICSNFFSLNCLIPFSILMSIIVLIFYRLKKDKTDLVSFGLIWFLICNAPRSTIIASSELVADYKAYIPAIGWLFLLSCGMIYLSKDWLKKNTLRYYLVLFAIILGSGSYLRNLVWSSPVIFWQDVVSKGPNKARSLNNLGVELNNAKRWDEAIPLFEQAIKIDSRYWDPYENLAASLAVIGDVDKAIEVGEKSLKINPYSKEAYSNLGSFYIFKNQFQKAEKYLLKSVSFDAKYGKSYYNLGRLYLEQNDPNRAWQNYRKACREADLDHDIAALLPYAGLSVDLEKWDDAIWAIKRILKLQPNHQDSIEHHFNLGNCYTNKKDYNSGIQIFKNHTEKYPEDYRAWCNLSELYLTTGQVDAAGEVLKKASRLHRYPGIEYQQAKYLLAKGDKAAAKKTLEAVLNSNPAPEIMRVCNELLSAI